MTAQTVENLLNDQLAACVAATQDCLAQSRRLRAANGPEEYFHMGELDYVAKLMKASARLTTAMAQLRGDTSHRIHVTRGEAGGKVDKG